MALHILDRASRVFSGLIDALCDSKRSPRVLLILMCAYAAVWTLYAVIAKSSQDLNVDMAEMVMWSRTFAIGYTKHPPFLAWVLAAWFEVFPYTDWAYLLLAACTCALGLWLAVLLTAHWLDGVKLAAVPFLLALIPFYNFFGLKFDQNSALIPLWAATALAFVRSLDRGALYWAVLAGLFAAAGVLTKYWSVFFLLALMIAVLFDPRRNDYFRSPAPYVTAAVAVLAVLPHAIWLVQHDFPPMQWVTLRRMSSDVGDWFDSLAEYSFGTLGYTSIALVAFAFAARPSRAALRDILLSSDPMRRRAALFFWLPMLLPIGVAALTRTNLLSLWNEPALSLLPVVLMASPAVTMPREAVARIAAAAIVLPLAMLLASPFIAYALLKTGVENDVAYARLAMAEMQRVWRQVSPRPLTIVGGWYPLANSASFYGADRPEAYANFYPYYAPDLTPARVRADGLAIVCGNEDRLQDQFCLSHMQELMATSPRSVKTDVTLRRSWLGLQGPPMRFVIAAVPPQ